MIELDEIGNVVLVGAGNMGGALARGWLAGGLPSDRLSVLDPHLSDDAHTFFRDKNVECLANVDEVARHGTHRLRCVLLAVKPQVFGAVSAPWAGVLGEKTCVVSVAAGIEVTDLARAFSPAPVIRAMPNMPAAVRLAMTVLVAHGSASNPDREVASALMGAVGDLVWIDDERHMHAVTALSGSGPAYVFYLTECLAEAGRHVGLPDDLAVRLARRTIIGASALLDAREIPPKELRRLVTSKGGTTAAALDVLADGDALADLFRRALAAAAHRSETLASPRDTSSA